MRLRDTHKEQAIKHFALQLIVEEGFDGFSMQKLAKLAGVSPATMYIYYKDKEDLIHRLAVEILKELFDQSLKDFDSTMSFAEGLRVQWLNRANYGISNPEKMYFMEQIKHSPFHEKVMTETGDDFSSVMKEFVMNAISRKELIRLPLPVLWSIAYAPLYNLIRFHNAGKSVGGQEFSFTEEIMDQTLKLVLKGLKP